MDLSVNKLLNMLCSDLCEVMTKLYVLTEKWSLSVQIFLIILSLVVVILHCTMFVSCHCPLLVSMGLPKGWIIATISHHVDTSILCS